MSKVIDKNKILDAMKDKYNKYDIAHIVNIIMEIDKRNKKDKGDLLNKWLNDRWYELKMKDKRELVDLIIKYKVPEFDTLGSEEISLLNNLLYVYDKIRNVTFKDIKDNELDIHVLSENVIEILKKQNVKIYDISEDLIDKIDDELDNIMSSVLKYSVNVHQFYDDETKGKYAIYCNVCNKSELLCFKAEIISDDDLKVLEKYGLGDEFVIAEGKTFDKEEMKFLFETDLKKYIDWNELTKRALDDIKKKFPEGTNVLLGDD